MKSTMFGGIILFSAAILFIATGCRKIKDNKHTTVTTITPELPISNTSAGKGGAASLRLVPNHDTINIDSCMVYIRYNSSVIALEMNQYDDSIWAQIEDGMPVATFSDLKPGNYYLFGKGWDIIRSLKVKGGLPFTISNERKGSTQTFVLPLQEY